MEASKSASGAGDAQAVRWVELLLEPAISEERLVEAVSSRNYIIGSGVHKTGLVQVIYTLKIILDFRSGRICREHT